MNAAAALQRIDALDLIRGFAVLGILAVNIASFAAPDTAIIVPYSPGSPASAAWHDALAFAFGMVVFEGKMRALFSMLFGASMLLFIERIEAGGRDGTQLQRRRLLWLALIGYLHFLLLWEGDILFLYAVGGLIALAARKLQARQLAITALLLFTVWQGVNTAFLFNLARAEAAFDHGTATPDQARELTSTMAEMRKADSKDIVMTRQGFVAQVGHRLGEDPLAPLNLVGAFVGETLSYVFVGMALFKSGFFSGGWSRRSLRRLLWTGLGLGGTATLAFATWAMANHFPPIRGTLALIALLGFPHLLMALGYAAALMLAMPWLLPTRIGRRIEAAGRMAFSNYLGTTLVMTAIFSGWGLGLFARFGTAWLWLFVALGWALMLAWSKPWLTRFRQGPLEWAWRSLTEWRMLPFRR